MKQTLLPLFLSKHLRFNYLISSAVLAYYAFSYSGKAEQSDGIAFTLAIIAAVFFLFLSGLSLILAKRYNVTHLSKISDIQADLEKQGIIAPQEVNADHQQPNKVSPL